VKKATLVPLLLVAPLCHADIVGFGVGANYWQQNSSGYIADDGEDIDIDDSLGWQSDEQAGFYAYVEHPVPLLPNVRVEMTQLSVDGSETLEEEISFSDTTYVVGSNVSSHLDLDYLEATLYYELLDNWVNLDAGINLWYLDGEISLDSEGIGREVSEISAPIPTLFAQARFDLPFSGFYAGGDMSFISFDGNSLSDYSAEIGYRGDLGLGAALGYRQIKLTIDEDDLESDIKIDGAYVSVSYHF